MATTSWSSTNGRWGTQVVHPDLGGEPRFSRGEGTLRALGRAGGMDCFEFTPGATGVWVLAGGDLVPVAGCEAVHHQDLQSSDAVTFLVARPGALWREYGYKRRSCTVCMLAADGSVATPPPAVLLASGAVEPREAPIAVPPPPPFNPAVAEALRRAGVLQ